MNNNLLMLSVVFLNESILTTEEDKQTMIADDRLSVKFLQTPKTCSI